MRLFSGKEREICIISTILIIILSNGLLFYFQNIMEHDLRNSTFEQQKQRQIEATGEISQRIGSDLNLVIGMLDGLANSKYLQDDQLSSNKTKKLLEEKYSQFSINHQQFMNVIDRLFILNKDNIVTVSLSQARSDSILNNDFSFQDWVIDTRKSLQPVFSGGFERVSLYSIYITIPIINRDTNKYIGIVGTSILTEKFFANYGNINNINRQFLVAYDKNGIMLANGASETLIGQNFFGDYTQQFIHHNNILNNLTRGLLAGDSGVALYDYGKGERLTTQYPIFVNGKPTYFIQVVTPTSQIYSLINNVVSVQQVKIFSFFAIASTIAIVVLLILLSKWNIILRREVKRRTKELEDSYDEMRRYLQEVLKEVNK
jgi:hypothetical protein